MRHIHLRKMNYLVKNQLVEGANVKCFHLEGDCMACKKGKQVKKSHLRKLFNSINMPLDHTHMDLFGPVNVQSIAETFTNIKMLIVKIESLYKLKVRRIHSDNGTDFKNNSMLIYARKDIFCTTSVLHSKLLVCFWYEVVACACYILNCVLTVEKHRKTNYELLNKRKPNLEFLEPFGCLCTILDPDGMFGLKLVEAVDDPSLTRPAVVQEPATVTQPFIDPITKPLPPPPAALNVNKLRSDVDVTPFNVLRMAVDHSVKNITKDVQSGV
nr:hypothetical protein [Tanacetum cinerariifolium]